MPDYIYFFFSPNTHDTGGRSTASSVAFSRPRIRSITLPFGRGLGFFLDTVALLSRPTEPVRCAVFHQCILEPDVCQHHQLGVHLSQQFAFRLASERAVSICLICFYSMRLPKKKASYSRKKALLILCLPLSRSATFADASRPGIVVVHFYADFRMGF
jgi:hypothetical protein